LLAPAGIATYLRAIGIDVQECNGIGQVVEQYYKVEARGRAPAVVVLNVRLGEESISLLAAELSERKGLQDLKILLVLPHISASAPKPLGLPNASAIVNSPVSRRELYEALATLTGQVAGTEQAAARELEFVPPTVEEAARHGCLILVAEDNETNQFVIR